MRRVVSSIMLACGLLAVSVGLVGLSLVPAPTPAAAAGKKVCTVTDERLVELSGLIATENGYVVINDGTEVASRERVFLLDRKCKVTKTVPYSGNGPRDPEDLAISADGETIWIADTGDNIASSDRRASVALWSMPVTGGSQPVLHRLAYPQGKAQDAEALLISDDGTPYVITKSLGKAEIYRPTGPLRKNNSEPVPMEKAGEISLPATTTANRFGPPGRITVTGAARSPDGKRVVLRTYADAFEWDVPDGDIVKALTTGKPRVTALADPFGEAIAYTPDGGTFLTVSDVGSLGEDAEVAILSYVPAKQEAAPVGAAAEDQAEQDGSWLDGLTLDQITYLIAGVGVLGVLLVGVGVAGIVLSRRRRSSGDATSDDDADDQAAPAAAARSAPVASAAVRPAPAGAGAARGRTYGGPAAGQAAPPRSGGVYGGGGAGGGGGAAGGAGGVYGGGSRPGGGVYGANQTGRPDRDGPDHRGRPDRDGGYGGGYGGNAAPGGDGVYGGNGAYGGYRPDDQGPRAGRAPRGHPDERSGHRGHGGPPVDPRYSDNGHGYR